MTKTFKLRSTMLLSCMVAALLILGIPLQAFAEDVVSTPDVTEAQNSGDTTEDTSDDPASDPLVEEEAEETEEPVLIEEDIVLDDEEEISELAMLIDTTGWTPVNGLGSRDITTFNVDSGFASTSSTATNMVGHITVGKPGLSSELLLRAASYYLTYNDVDGAHTITYGFTSNGFTTSHFNVYLRDGNGALRQYELSDKPIKSIWTKEITPGYSEVMFVSDASIYGLAFEIALILTPDSSGAVTHSWVFYNVSSSPSPINLGMLASIDTELVRNDHVSVFSRGTDQGLFIADQRTITSVHFPMENTPTSPSGYAAGRWNVTRYTDAQVFGANLAGRGEGGISRNWGDLAFSGADSAILFKWDDISIAPGDSREFSYVVALAQGEVPGIDYTIEEEIEELPLSAIPATGTTILLPLAVGFALAALGCVLLVVSRRQKKF